MKQEGSNLVITNEDHQDWNNVRVTVNEKYRCRPVHVDASGTARVPLLRCVAEDGQRFNLFTTAPVTVFVRAVLVDDTEGATNVFQFER